MLSLKKKNNLNSKTLQFFNQISTVINCYTWKCSKLYKKIQFKPVFRWDLSFIPSLTVPHPSITGKACLALLTHPLDNYYKKKDGSLSCLDPQSWLGIVKTEATTSSPWLEMNKILHSFLQVFKGIQKSLNKP